MSGSNDNIWLSQALQGPVRRIGMDHDVFAVHGERRGADFFGARRRVFLGLAHGCVPDCQHLFVDRFVAGFTVGAVK
jgi:hypothetical protein